VIIFTFAECGAEHAGNGGIILPNVNILRGTNMFVRTDVRIIYAHGWYGFIQIALLNTYFTCRV
jgi:hypothetical protein